ncbi:hypothetical protein OG618_37445 (plasmid) [Kitasatospora sp. NBC_01246]|uniref:hypothetical protein n=1 Tax=Kitasatospora sp. NBC_01246 TaxID=2903570 RepID=UPI002E32F909|nr:hypothetical protein [Kitasatospora sp. NBC_01246]
MHTDRANVLRTALTTLAGPGDPTDDYGHGLEDAKAAIREALTDHPDPERSLRTWAARLPGWKTYGHQAGYDHIQQEARRILNGDEDTLADYRPPA